MSNAAIIPITKTYPVFEPNQVLSDDHLNDLRNYFDAEIRSTRNQLIGTGIISGLEITPSRRSITITGGAGISTDGHLIASAADKQVYTKVLNYQFTDEEAPLKKLIYDTLSEGLRTVNGEEQHYFLDAEKTPRKLIVGIYELTGEDNTSAKAMRLSKVLTEDVMTKGDSCIALYHESIDTDIKSCFTTNCDERGIEITQTVRPLLIITNRPPKVKKAFAWQSVPPIPRIKIEHSNAPKLLNSFSVACNDALLINLQNIINRVTSHLKDQLGDERTQVLERIREHNKKEGNSRTLKTIKDDILLKNPYYIPYFYELLKDIVQALHDLQAVAEGIEEETRVMPDVFADYLILGSLNPKSHRFPRTEFASVRPDDSTGHRLDEIEFYLIRLQAMISCFNPGPQSGIRITPSHTTTQNLQDQSMPYSYSQLEQVPLYQYWNRKLNLQDGGDHVLSYYGEDYGGGSQFKKPLDYCHEGKDLLLVEDCIGLQKSVALEELQQLKKTNHLSFGLVALRVSSTNHDAPYIQPSMSDPIYYIREDNFKNFIEENPGLYPARGIRKNGTLVLVFEAEPDDTDGPVVGVLALPYICCGRPVEPEPFVLDAHDDEVGAVANAVTDIDPLINDEYDPHSPFELDLIDEFVLDARDEEIATITDGVADIDVLNNDLYDLDSPIEVDLLSEIDANDVAAEVMANDTIDIDVLENDTTDPGDIELDFADQP